MLENIEEIGKRIKHSREEQGTKQQVLASEAKIDSASLSRYENGRQEPSLETFVKIAQVLNVSTDYLLFGKEKQRIFSEDKDENKASMWSEVVCYALATLIETNTIKLDYTDKTGKIILDFEKNESTLKFFDKLLKLSELKDSFSDEQYESAKLKIINDYKHKIMSSDYENNNKISYGDNRYIVTNERKCDEIMRLILENHKKITL